MSEVSEVASETAENEEELNENLLDDDEEEENDVSWKRRNTGEEA